jgi:hypothetical protein
MYYLLPLTSTHKNLWSEFIKITETLQINNTDEPIKDVWFLYNTGTTYTELNDRYSVQASTLVDEERNMYCIYEPDIPSILTNERHILTLPLTIDQHNFSYIVIFTNYACILARYGRLETVYDEETIHYVSGRNPEYPWRCSASDIQDASIIPNALIRDRIMYIWSQIIS